MDKQLMDRYVGGRQTDGSCKAANFLCGGAVLYFELVFFPNNTKKIKTSPKACSCPWCLSSLFFPYPIFSNYPEFGPFSPLPGQPPWSRTPSSLVWIIPVGFFHSLPSFCFLHKLPEGPHENVSRSLVSNSSDSSQLSKPQVLLEVQPASWSPTPCFPSHWLPPHPLWLPLVLTSSWPVPSSASLLIFLPGMFLAGFLHNPFSHSFVEPSLASIAQSSTPKLCSVHGCKPWLLEACCVLALTNYWLRKWTNGQWLPGKALPFIISFNPGK